VMSIINHVVLVVWWRWQVVVVCNDWCLDDQRSLAFCPVPRQQHGCMLTEVLVDVENGKNYEDKLTIENDFPFICFPLAFLWFWQGLDGYGWIFDSRILWLRICSD
jgi:hypothetical protein